MKKLIYSPNFVTNTEDKIRYKEDVDRIVSAFAENDCQISDIDAASAWAMYSEEYYCAGWLMLPESNKHIYDILLPFFKEIQPFDWDKWLKDTEELRKNVDWDDVQEAIDEVRHPERHMWTRLPKLPEDPSVNYLIAWPNEYNPNYGQVTIALYDDHKKMFYYDWLGKRIYIKKVYAWQICPTAPKIREVEK